MYKYKQMPIIIKIQNYLKFRDQKRIFSSWKHEKMALKVNSKNQKVIGNYTKMIGKYKNFTFFFNEVHK